MAASHALMPFIKWEKFMVEKVNKKKFVVKNFVLAGYRQKYFNAEDFCCSYQDRHVSRSRATCSLNLSGNL